MLRKTQKIPTLLACSLTLWAAVFAPHITAQTPPATVTAVAPATLDRLFSEADAAFGEKNFDLAVEKLQELLQALGTSKAAPLELLYFNIGYGYLMAGKGPEAEAAFADCLKRFPRGEYATRCALGIGRACVLQATPEKQKQAIDALRSAALDPAYRSQAGFTLAEVYTTLGRREEALVVLKSLSGSDIRSPEQTSAAVEVISLLADAGNKEDLIAYLDRLGTQDGVRDAMAWYGHQLIGRGEEQLANQAVESALVIFRAVPPRSQILEVQKAALDHQRRNVKILENRVAAEKSKALDQRSSASSLLSSLKPSLEMAEKELAAVEGEIHLDASVLMRRGRCLYLLDRYEEALVCFRTIRLKHSSSPDAKGAAFGEIIIFSKLKNPQEVRTLGEAYFEKYPDADNVEQVATSTMEVLYGTKNWAEVRAFASKLIAKFPQSPSLDRFTFFLGMASFIEGTFAESTPVFSKLVTDFPNSPLVEDAMYNLAMSHFLSNNSQETSKSCKEYLSKFPEGRYAGDMRYRLAFIDFNTKEPDQTAKIIRDLSSFLNLHPDDAAVGSMYCLLGDTYKRQTSDKLDEIAKFEKQALDSYKLAVWTDSADDVVQYGLDQATAILQASKDWPGIAELHNEFLKRKPDSPLALLSAIQISKMSVRQGKSAEAAQMLGDALKARISDPNSEQVEFMIDELVKTLMPRKVKPAEIDATALEAQLSEIFSKITDGKENPTANARLYYGKAQLARLLKRPLDTDRYLAGIAKDNAKDPSALSPLLLATSGDILTKLGDYEGATSMFKRLTERYKGGMFADAGPVGLGQIALAQKKPAEALKIFDEALEQNPGLSRFKETTLGKLQALVDLDRLDEANTKGLEIIGDKMFRGEFAGKAYLTLIQIRRKQAAKAPTPAAKTEFLAQAQVYCNKLATAYRSSPDVCAEGHWQNYEILLEMGDKNSAKEALTKLVAEPKLSNTARAKQAAEALK